MTTKDDLLALEKQFWTGDAEFYRRNLDDPCLTAFTEMAGVFDKEEIAATIKGGQRWRDLELEYKGLIEPVPDMAILTYQAKAKRENGAPYSALVSSGYAKREGGWKMTFHQQTPLEAGKK